MQSTLWYAGEEWELVNIERHPLGTDMAHCRSIREPERKMALPLRYAPRDWADCACDDCLRESLEERDAREAEDFIQPYYDEVDDFARFPPDGGYDEYPDGRTRRHPSE